MQHILTVVILLAMFGTPALSQNLTTLSLDDVAAIGLQIEADSTAKCEGRASTKITTLWPTTVCLGEVEGPAIENAKLVYTARVKTALEGSAYLEMWAHLGGGQYFSRGMNSTVSGRSDWQTIQTPFFFQMGQTPDKVTLNLVINGKGTVWIDDIVISGIE